MDVGAWLRNLGLGQYEAVFREHEIDAEVLPDLTDADLEKLGAPLGHRKRLLKAIAGLGVPAGGSTPAAPVSSLKADAAERRQLTVMFCDLVGSTALAARLDPEDMREIIAAYHQCCASLIVSNGGFIAKYMGDGVLAYFGYPHAHEHDAERAVRAGLAIVEAAPKLETAAGGPLHVRLGIATGIVVVGDLLGSGESQERGVVGDTPNLAARLQGIAEPDSVVIAENTRKLLGDLFELRDLGPQDLKGVAGPTRVYAALRESSQESRFEALHAGGLTALVGREEESELLLRRWAKAKAGEGQVVLLSGEAGIGKSRLTAALLERLMGEPHVRMRYFCSPQHTDSALYPIIGHMARAAGFARDDDPKARLDKLDALLARSATSREDAALVAEMLSLPNDGRYPALELSPQQRRQKTLEALIGQIEAIARESPVLMIFEDAHWADPSSLEVFGRLVDEIDTLRVLLFVTFRPEFAAPWVGRSHVTALMINRLGTQRREVALIEAGSPATGAAREHVRQDIVERTDRIPLFVEEMTGSGTGSRGCRRGGARGLGSLVSRAQHFSEPTRLANGAARISWDPPERWLESALAIGRSTPMSFWLLVAGNCTNRCSVRRSISYFSPDSCPAWARRRTRPTSSSMRWCRTQPTALCCASRAARCTPGSRTGLKVGSPTSPRASRSCWRVTALRRRKSKRRSAFGARRVCDRWLDRRFSRARRSWGGGLGQTSDLFFCSGRRRQQIALQVGLANVQMHTRGHAAPETKASFDRAHSLIERAAALGEPFEDPLALFSILYGFWAVNFIVFNGRIARDLASEYQALAQKKKHDHPSYDGASSGRRLSPDDWQYHGKLVPS